MVWPVRKGYVFFAEYLVRSHIVKTIVVGKNNGKNNNRGVFNNVPYEFIKFNFLQLCFSYHRVHKLLIKEFDPSRKNVNILVQWHRIKQLYFFINRKTPSIQNYNRYS